MSDEYFVDTNIVMYAHDSAGEEKHERAKEPVERLWRARAGVVSTQVLQELAVNLRKKARRPLSAMETREIVADYLTWRVIVNRGSAILEALDLEIQHQVSFWDALVIRAARSARVDTLYSEDLSHGRNYGGVVAMNPLLEQDFPS